VENSSWENEYLAIKNLRTPSFYCPNLRAIEQFPFIRDAKDASDAHI